MISIASGDCIFTNTKFIDNPGGNTVYLTFGSLLFVNCFFTNKFGGSHEITGFVVTIIQSTFYNVEDCIASASALTVIASTVYHPTVPSMCSSAFEFTSQLTIYSSIISSASSSEIYADSPTVTVITDELSLLTNPITSFSDNIGEVNVSKADLCLDCSATGVSQPYCITNSCSRAINRGSNFAGVSSLRSYIQGDTDIAGALRKSSFRPSALDSLQFAYDIIDTGSYELQFPPPTLTPSGPFSVSAFSSTSEQSILTISSSVILACSPDFKITLGVSVTNGALSFTFQGAPFTVSSSSPVSLVGTFNELNNAFTSVVFDSLDVNGFVTFTSSSTNGVSLSAEVDFLIVSATPSASPAVSGSTSPASATKTKTSTPTPTSSELDQEVTCTEANSCTSDVVQSLRNEGYDPCEDTTGSCGENTKCFDSSKGGATSKCKSAADYNIKITKSSSKKDQQLTVFSTTGEALAKVEIKGDTLPPGTTLSVKWRPSPAEEPDVDSPSQDSSSACDSSEPDVFSQFASPGTLEIVAKDKNGKKISKLDGKVSVTLPSLKKDKKNSKKSCVGYKDNDEPYKCDDKDPKSEKDDADAVDWQSQEFDHLTTFAIFFQFGGSFNCGNTRVYWIISLCLLGTLPCLLALLCLLYTSPSPRD
eukprot:TRINITY_DN2640_c0_g1_i2.p1 TRINITY_DN2640_c0_g1~~TRINITY_DN2640_c0_g1_i2.p1  ORF type:complete len:649 (-),score=74.35 TRINITY_DN2640_c0_g1_i2:16-1962(-)